VNERRQAPARFHPGSDLVLVNCVAMKGKPPPRLEKPTRPRR
jgi:hypothetical protein